MVVHRSSFLTGCWSESSVPYSMGFWIGLLTTWQPTSFRAKYPRERAPKLQLCICSSQKRNAIISVLLPWSTFSCFIRGQTGLSLTHWPNNQPFNLVSSERLFHELAQNSQATSSDHIFLAFLIEKINDWSKININSCQRLHIIE